MRELDSERGELRGEVVHVASQSLDLLVRLGAQLALVGDLQGGRRSSAPFEAGLEGEEGEREGRTSVLASEKSSTLRFSSSLMRSSVVFSSSAHLATSVSLLRLRLALLLLSAVHSVSRLETCAWSANSSRENVGEVPPLLNGTERDDSSIDEKVDDEKRGCSVGEAGLGDMSLRRGDEATERRPREVGGGCELDADEALLVVGLRLDGRRKKLLAPPLASPSAESPRPKSPPRLLCSGVSALPRRCVPGPEWWRAMACEPDETDSRRRSVSSRNSLCVSARARFDWAILSCAARSSCVASCCVCERGSTSVKGLSDMR